MFSTLRTRFGIPGVISVIALVFAMFGGAYAASNSSGGGKATASAKAKKGPRGPKGATGPAGPAGAQGPAGPAGAKGDAGSNGPNGNTGPTGPQGLQGKQGVTGPQGPEGSPWTAGGTLPSGKTETGMWGYDLTGDFGTPLLLTTISFPIPLADGQIDAAFIFNQQEMEQELFGKPKNESGHFKQAGGCEVGSSAECFDTGCRGSVLEPTAPKGVLCIYTGPGEETTEVEGVHLRPELGEAFAPFGGEFAPNGYGPSGTFITGLTGTQSTSVARAGGSWAVTAP